MSYSLDDVQAVEAAIKRLRPDADFSHTDYDFGLSVRFGTQAYILFQRAREEGDIEITTDIERAELIAFVAGEQWTINEVRRFMSNGSVGRNTSHSPKD